VIFDCDGVLVDSERLAVKVDVLVLRRLGWPLTEAGVIERFVGRSEQSMQEDVEAHLGRKLSGSWADEFGPLYRQVLESELTPVRGVVDALSGISLPTCVASSSTHERLRLTLGLCGLYEQFAGRIFSATEVANGKPAPDLFLHAAAQIGVDPRACAVVEDSRYGVQAARAAGMHAFAFAGGLTPASALEGPNTTVFHEMHELPALLGCQPRHLDTLDASPE
jgi:HAD superfamily hydrolase (TIGR01509 family)